MKNYRREISGMMPDHIPSRFLAAGEPIFAAYGCVVLERVTGRSYVYTAVNLTSGYSEILRHRAAPLTTSGVDAMIEKLRGSAIAGAGIWEADRAFGKKLAYNDCRRLLFTLFKEIFPQHGYAIRREQISLASHIQDVIGNRGITLAEAEVGTGKTLAYLVPAVLAKRGRLNGYWNTGTYEGMPYAETAHMPIVIATSSIALQKALITDFIPALSDMLLEHGFIKTPLTAALRKGREHYVCTRNLRAHLFFERDPEMSEILERLCTAAAPIDLAETEGMNPYVKRRIAVPDHCDAHCPFRMRCAYLIFRENAQSARHDIQVCNHNYLLADTLRRAEGKRPLIPNYQMLIIDEAHKFVQAARTMYGAELSSRTQADVREEISRLRLHHGDAEKLARTMAKKLSKESKRLFSELTGSLPQGDTDDDSDRTSTVVDQSSVRHIRNIRDIADKLSALLRTEPAIGNGAGLKAHILWELTQIREKAAILSRHHDLIYWRETSRRSALPEMDMEVETYLCAVPKDLDRRLYDDLWSKEMPIILTSGTLSAAGDFSRTKRTLGTDLAGSRLTEASKPSPFDYREHAMIYISDAMPFPDKRDSRYILAAANEIEQLVYASHGHAAVLFTSYRVMDMVWEHLSERDMPFPLFRLDKGGVREIERFKRSGNGVLFAAGALWEGIDIPGDALSMLIIVKLPFAVPDPVSEYERTLYADMDAYKSAVIVPEMLIKLKQGFGRLIRTEKDTGCVAILDSRAGTDGAYREKVLDALPDCYVTNDLAEVKGFFRVVKKPDYFEAL